MVRIPRVAFLHTLPVGDLRGAVKGSLCLVLVAALPACTSITVRPVEEELKPAVVCIQENPRVIVEDFLLVLRDGFARHGILSNIYSDEPPPGCEFLVTYTALRSWDFAPYLAHAEIRIEKDGLEVGYGEFHLRGKGGYSLYKWQGTRTKMDPVIDQLFADQPLR